MTGNSSNVREVSIRFSGIDDTRPAFESLAGRLRDLRSTTGARGSIGIIGSTLLGAGAVGGLTLLGERLAAISAKAVELRNDFADGKISIGEAVEKAAALVPVLGPFWTLGRNIRELFSDEEHSLSKIVELEAQRLKTAGGYLKVIQDVQKAELESTARGVSNARKLQLLQASPDDRARLQAQADFDAQSRKEQDRYNDLLRTASPDSRAAINRQKMAAVDDIERQRKEYIDTLVEQQTLQKTENEMKARHILTNELADKEIERQKREQASTEEDLKNRRKIILESAGLSESTFGKPRPGRAVDISGLAPFSAAGLLTGQAEHAGGVDDIPKKQLSAAERSAKALEQMLRDRRNLQLQPTS